MSGWWLFLLGLTSKKGNMEILLNILLYALCSIPILAVAALAYLLLTPRKTRGQ